MGTEPVAPLTPDLLSRQIKLIALLDPYRWGSGVRTVTGVPSFIIWDAIKDLSESEAVSDEIQCQVHRDIYQWMYGHE